uniref:Uncharacterized protein n=1 Tax=Cacopsylla melanoneura TaxID=428564 RepID=A0A8D8R4E5_9HEMI
MFSLCVSPSYNMKYVQNCPICQKYWPWRVLLFVLPPQRTFTVSQHLSFTPFHPSSSFSSFFCPENIVLTKIPPYLQDQAFKTSPRGVNIIRGFFFLSSCFS